MYLFQIDSTTLLNHQSFCDPADTDFRPGRTLSHGTFYSHKLLAFLIPGRFYLWNKSSRECFITRHILAPGSFGIFYPRNILSREYFIPGRIYHRNTLSLEEFIMGRIYPWKNLSREDFITQVVWHIWSHKEFGIF